VTPTLLSLFDGIRTSEGIELRWQFGVPAGFLGAQVERSNSASGPWSPVIGERRDMSETAILLDRGVEADRAYYYRLVATRRDGNAMTFGPLEVTATLTMNRFALLAREARVRLSVLDIQGRRIAQVADAVYRPGRYQAVWDGRIERGRAPEGLYLVRYEWPGQHSVRRLWLAH
jgi:hypothetical protein